MGDDVTSAQTANLENMRFEELLKELTQVVEPLERGNLSLDEAVAQYARGTELLKAAQKVLDSAQARLEVMMGVMSEDGPKVESVSLEEFLKR